MKCSKCHTDNPEVPLFCGQCGSQCPSLEEAKVSEGHEITI